MGEKLKLTRAQREKLFAGEFPHISGEGVCPVRPGDTYALSSRLTIHVLGAKRTTEGWTLHYELHDRRDPIRLLRRTPSTNREDFDAIRKSFDDYGYPEEPTPEVLHRAAQESAYTGTGSSLGGGEAVDEHTQDRFTANAHKKDAERRQERHERDIEILRDQLAIIREWARERRIDARSEIRVLERRLQEKLRKAAA